MIKRLLFIFSLIPFLGVAQFAPAAGQPGSSAIKNDSTIIINWASGCKIIRGRQDISNVSGGYASVGDSSKAIGFADGLGVVSLGDGGSAVLTFPQAIKNLAGPDFCVFENSFDPGFLELAFVEVSSDGINFTRFPATCNVQNTVQIGPFDTSSDATKINNLAGKYIGGYGVPFDLLELTGIPGLNINAVTHVKIIDVVGCIQPQYARYDKNNNIINDPWATPYSSGGFDLDGVGVLNQAPAGIQENDDLNKSVRLFPTVTNDEIYFVNESGQPLELEVTDISSKMIKTMFIKKSGSISLASVVEGIYFIKIKGEHSSLVKKIIKTN
ncbi:MAG: T9SS type A sorting domain-containing protein [Bacteroidetes bacterium]|nr:T9SS type A sorting domain-containing protein [Bacteroidota bacterium]